MNEVWDCAPIRERSRFGAVLRDPDLLPVVLGRDAHHVPFRIHMILGELDVLQDPVDLLVVVVQDAHAQQDDPGKVTVPFDLPQVRAVEKNLVLAHKVRV